VIRHDDQFILHSHISANDVSPFTSLPSLVHKGNENHESVHFCTAQTALTIANFPDTRIIILQQRISFSILNRESSDQSHTAMSWKGFQKTVVRVYTIAYQTVES
jgi:hypothetical protein